jgi:hypothetical protein
VETLAEFISMVLGLATSFAALFVAIVLTPEPRVPRSFIVLLLLFGTWVFVRTGLSATQGLEVQE